MTPANNYEILKVDEASKAEKNILSDEKILSQEIVTTGGNVEKRGAGKTYEQLWEQHQDEMKLFDLQLETAKKNKKAEDILISARKENLATEGKQTRVKAELTQINTLLKNTGTASIQDTLIASLVQIGNIKDEQLKTIATNLKLTDTAALAGLVEICSDCVPGTFNINAVRAVGKVQFFAKEQYLQDVKEAYNNGTKYGIDRSAGTATFMTIRKILAAYTELSKPEKPTSPAGQTKAENTIPQDEVFTAIENEKIGEKKEVIRKGLTEKQKIQAKTIYSELQVSKDEDITTVLSNKNDRTILDGVRALFVEKIANTSDAKEKTRLENIAKKIITREDEIINAGKGKTPEKKEEQEDGWESLSDITIPVYGLVASSDKNAMGPITGYEIAEGDPNEYETRAKLLMLNYIAINGIKCIDIKDNIKCKYDEKKNIFALKVKIQEDKAEGETENKILKLNFSLVENTKFGNRVEFKVTSDDKEYTAGKFMVYDIHAPTTSEKLADVRTIYNREKTIENLKKEMSYNLIKPFETKLSTYENLDFLKEIKLNDELEIDEKFIPIDDADLGDKEKYKDINGYYKKVYINYQGDHAEVGKIYFKKDGTLDTEKLKNAELKIYGVDLKPAFEVSKTAKTVNFNIEDAQLKELNDKINKQKKQITDGLTSLSKNVDTSLMTNLQREKLQDVSNIALYPLRDLYSYNVIETGGKEKKKTEKNKTNIYFNFDTDNAIQITNYFGENTSNKAVVEIEDTKKGGKTIKRDFELTLNGTNLTSLETKEKTATEGLPTVKGVTLPENTRYNVTAKKLAYYDTKGLLSTSINCESPKVEKDSKWELLDNNSIVDPLDFFDTSKIGTCATLGETEKENIFKMLMTKELDGKVIRSSTIRILKDTTKMTYEYYIIKDNKDGTFTAQKDKELTEAADKASEKMKNDFLIIDKINTINLKLWEKVTKKEKDLSINSGLGGIGICNVSAEQIIKFVQGDEKIRLISATIGKDESSVNTATQKIEFLPKDQPITFSISEQGINLKDTSTTIASENYTLNYDKDGNKLLLEKGKVKKKT